MAHFTVIILAATCLLPVLMPNALAMGKYGGMENVRAGWGKRSGYGQYGHVQAGWGKRSSFGAIQDYLDKEISNKQVKEDLMLRSLSNTGDENDSLSNVEKLSTDICEDFQALVNYHLSKALQYQKMIDETCPDRI